MTIKQVKPDFCRRNFTDKMKELAKRTRSELNEIMINAKQKKCVVIALILRAQINGVSQGNRNRNVMHHKYVHNGTT